MPIPETQLETWSHQGAITTPKQTHEAIRRALSAPDSPLASYDVEVYLQGSYKNDTNIRGSSDVDIVVQLNSVFWADKQQLTVSEQQLLTESFQPATYHWEQYRQDVLTALRTYFGRDKITEGNKSLKLLAGGTWQPADVVPCMLYRRYRRFASRTNNAADEGIVFWTRKEHREVVNYPKVHYANGVAKNAATATNGWYKPVVRMFKNARQRLVEQGRLKKEQAPSYFVECLLYNVPDTQFGRSFQQTYANALNWLSASDLSRLTCQNGIISLLGNSPEQWNGRDASALIDGLIDLWNRW